MSYAVLMERAGQDAAMEERFVERVVPWTVDDAADVADQVFGVRGVATLLSGERDENFRIDTGAASFVLKVTHPSEPMEVTRYQAAAQEHAAQMGARVPALLPTADGQPLGVVDLGAGPRAVRLIEHVAGLPMAKTVSTARQRRAVGAALASLNGALATFAAPAPDLDLLWNSERVEGLAHLLPHVFDEARRALAERTLHQVATQTLPRLAHLPRQLIHNDANPWNVMVSTEQPEQVLALLDLGDVVIATRAQDVAVAAAYLVQAEGHPLAGPADLVAGFHGACRLADEELSVLPDLIRGRMLTTVLITEWRSQLFPENRDYILRNNPNAWLGLQRLEDVGADEAMDVLRRHMEEDA